MHSLTKDLFLENITPCDHCSVFLMDKYWVSSGQANILDSLSFLVATGMSPVLGAIVDKTGLNLMWSKK